MSTHTHNAPAEPTCHSHSTHAADLTHASTVRLHIEGMHCAGCTGHVEDALIQIQGVREAQVSLTAQSALVRGTELHANELADAVKKAGFAATPILKKQTLAQRRDVLMQKQERTRKKWKSRVRIGATIWLPLEALHLLGTPLLGFPKGFAHDPSGPVLWIIIFGATLVLLYVGSAFFASAFKATKAKTTNMDTLVSIGALAAFSLSIVNLIRILSVHAQNTAALSTGSTDLTSLPHLPLYFLEAAGLLTLIATGHWLEATMTSKAGSALDELLTLQPETVTRLSSPEDSTGTPIATDDILPGDLVLIRPGDRVAVDGTIVQGRAALDESVVTGESIPIEKGPGAEVVAGSMDTNGRLVVKATGPGTETTLASIAESVIAAQASKTNIQRIADKVSSIFVPAVLGVALLSLFGWGFLMGEWGIGVISATTVLVISCPCALGLATPTAIMVGSGAASKRGILVRSAAALERVSSINTIAFDKTGTLTQGMPRVVQANDETLTLAGAIARASTHPLSIAIVDEMQQRGLRVEPATDIIETPGVGITGTIAGQRIEILSRSQALERNISLVPDDADSASHNASFKDASQSVVLREGELVGVVAFRDEPRPEAAELLTQLKERHVESWLLSGDRQSVAEAIGIELGIAPERIRGELSPEDKVACIEEIVSGGKRLAMVGDGINDAAALARAGALGGMGIAMGTVTNVAIERADVVIPGHNIFALTELLPMGTLTMRTIKQNLMLSFFYNTLAIPAAAFGLLGVSGPIIAALAMGLSDTSVIGNSLRLAARFRRERTHAQL